MAEQREWWALRKEQVFDLGWPIVVEKKAVTIDFFMYWNADSYTKNIVRLPSKIRTGDGDNHVEELRASHTPKTSQLVRKTGKLREYSSNTEG